MTRRRPARRERRRRRDHGHRATNADGAITSTAAQVVAAINASPAKDLVTASVYRTNAGAGVVAATAASRLDDFLNAPTSQPRGPIEVQGIRIGNDVGGPQGSKVGVFIVCQEHAREWTTPLVCLETAERLLRNYPTDPETKALVDGLDIFIIPSVNPDGATYSMYDFSGQRKNLTNHCASNPTGNNDPAARTTLGRRHQPQLLGRHDLGGLHRRVHELHGDELHGPVPVLGA